MATTTTSTKRAMIDKAKSTTLIVTSVAAFVVVFSLVSSKSLIAQMSYQNRVISAKQATLDTLEADVEASNKLKKTYDEFVSRSTNVIGGDPTGENARDGDNAKIVLDALPSKYDFPALATSLEGLISGESLKIDKIDGVDDELAQLDKQTSPKPVVVDMPFSFQASGSYANIQSLINKMQRSIRPFSWQTVSFSGDETDLQVDVTAKTYYQPEKTLKITEEVIQ